MRHFAQTEADRQRRIVETFSKAVEQLGSDKLEVRVGAIFALERISKESPDDYWTIMEVLTAFVRERMRYTTIMARLSERAYFLWLQAGRPEGHSEEFWVEAVRLERLDQMPTDIAAILTVIARRSIENQRREKDRGWYLDLSKTYLIEADLSEVVLRTANLDRTHLEGAVLLNAQLEGAVLYGAHLEGADLQLAHLERADLVGADLERAVLWGAHLERASLGGAYLEEADLHEAHLEEADLLMVRLERADLGHANFKRTRLDGARLEGALFYGTHLEGADLSYALGLTDDQLSVAFGDGETRLPEGMRRPESWPPLQ